jgi:hypothetical protein
MAKEHLIKAKALIEQGWTRGSLKVTRPDGVVCYCLDGAIAEAHGFDASNDSEARNIYNVLEEDENVFSDVSLVHSQIKGLDGEQRYPVVKDRRDMLVTQLYRFNDSHTKEDVIAVLDAAIEKAE